ncbi:hypothetical protein GCM10009527_035800 [Actinomadura nitritigenes]
MGRKTKVGGRFCISDMSMNPMPRIASPGTRCHCVLRAGGGGGGRADAEVAFTYGPCRVIAVRLGASAEHVSPGQYGVPASAQEGPQTRCEVPGGAEESPPAFRPIVLARNR